MRIIHFNNVNEADCSFDLLRLEELLKREMDHDAMKPVGVKKSVRSKMS
jgi:hypothetical protein